MLRIGMVGLGHVATAHLKGYINHPAAVVAAICDLDDIRARAFAATHGIDQVFSSYDEMLRSADLDLIDIATPTFLHADMTIRAASAGKHVHCEKPFCRSVGEGRRACAMARSQGVKLLVGETYIFISSHVKARQLINDGAIGRPLQIRQRHGAWLERQKPLVYSGPADRNWRVDPEQSGGGAFPWIYDHAVHFFATAEFLMLDLPIVEVFAAKAGNRGLGTAGAGHDPYTGTEQDIPIITWKHIDIDIDCQGVWMRAEHLNGKFDYMRGFSTTVIGDRGMIEVLGEGGHNLFWDGRQQHLVLHRPGQSTECFRFDEGGDDVWESDISYYGRGHEAQVCHLIDCVLQDRPTKYTGEDGVRAVRATLAAIRSAESGRAVRLDQVAEDYTAY